MSMHDRETRPRAGWRGYWWGGLLLLGVIAVGVAVYRFGPWFAEPAGRPREELAEFFEKAHLAVGYLENLQLDQAEPLLADLQRRLPDEPIGTRNLAICRYLIFEQQRIEAPVVMAALDAVEKVEPHNPTAAWLRARTIYRKNPADPAPALAAYDEAARRAPDNPIYPYEIYTVASMQEDAESKAKATTALRQAYELAPRNLFVLVDWMLVQAQEQDPALRETLRDAAEVLLPLRRPIQRRNNVDLLQLLEQAEQAAAAGNWQAALRPIRIIWNVVRPHDFAQSDKRALTPHPLEFAARELSAKFREQYEPATAPPAAEFPLTLATSTALPRIAAPGARDAMLIDFDLDGRLDVALVTNERIDVWRYNAGAWDKAASSELPRPVAGLLAADLDHDRNRRVIDPDQPQPIRESSPACFDADPDFVLYGPQGIVVLRNDLAADTGERSLVVVPQEESSEGASAILSARLVDFDHDSLLDIAATTDSGLLLLLAQGQLTFADVTEFSQLPSFERPITSLAAVDWDRDIDIDLIAVAPDAATIGYLENLRHGDFRWRRLGSDFETLVSARVVNVLDVDGNVSWDLVGVTPEGLRLVRSQMPAPGKVEAMSTVTVSPAALSGCTVADLDNDGYQDLVAWQGRSVSAWRAGTDGQFAGESGLSAEVAEEILRCEPGDLDQDGDLDLALLTAEGVVFLENQGGNKNNWLAIRAMGQVDNAGKANHHGIGSLLEMKAGPLYQAQVVERPVTHFGLGQRQQADIVRILWTNGVPQAAIQPAANQSLCEPMTLKGSCPYLYTWTGERFEFFTDCLWAAPIGLQLAEGVLAPSRSWEYLQIPGNRLREHEGRYTLQVTEELWEATYFDQMRLIAVDHPADVEIYSNEKVGPAEIAQFKLHPVRKRRYPVAAHDSRGRDVLDVLTQRDERYLRAFDEIIAPGLAEEHFVELDLGQLESPETITLFLTGWIYPTDTSTNVSLSRRARPGGPKPPALQVLDDQGNWKTVQAFMGFPGGKTKTIAIDLSQAFLTTNYRLRIATSAQIYWDEAFFTVNEPPAQTREIALTLESADLHYRGFSAARPPRENAPETYDYERVSHATRWAPMAGQFTRYGEVTELLHVADDCMVVMSAGDEMTVSFTAPAEDPPAGWVRDFVLHNVGWDKDADLNTVYGQSAEPLPFNDMGSYADPTDGFYPNTDKHREYLRTYQTRIQDPLLFWRQIKQYRKSGR